MRIYCQLLDCKHLLDQHGPAVANTIALHMMLFAYMAAAQNMNDNSGVGICHPMSPQTPFWRHIGMKKSPLTCMVWHGRISAQWSKTRNCTSKITSCYFFTHGHLAVSSAKKTSAHTGCFLFWFFFARIPFSVQLNLWFGTRNTLISDNIIWFTSGY